MSKPKPIKADEAIGHAIAASKSIDEMLTRAYALMQRIEADKKEQALIERHLNQLRGGYEH